MPRTHTRHRWVTISWCPVCDAPLLLACHYTSSVIVCDATAVIHPSHRCAHIFDMTTAARLIFADMIDERAPR